MDVESIPGLLVETQRASGERPPVFLLRGITGEAAMALGRLIERETGVAALLVAPCRPPTLEPFAGITELVEQAFALATRLGRQDLAYPHWIALRLLAPAVGQQVPARRHDPIHHEYRRGDTERRAPFFWTQRCYHAMVDFLLSLAGAAGPQPLCIGLIDADRGGPEVREFLAVLARRGAHPSLLLWLATAAEPATEWTEWLAAAGRSITPYLVTVSDGEGAVAETPDRPLERCSVSELVEAADFASFHGAWADAIACARMALVKIVPGDDPTFRRVIEALRVALNGLNQNQASEQLLLQELAHTADRKRRVTILNYLAIGLAQTGGSLEQAERYARLARETAEQGQDEAERAALGLVAAHGMIIVLARLRRPDEGFELGRQAVAALIRQAGDQIEVARQSMVLYLMGQCAELLGRFDEAVDHYRRSLAVDPHYPEYYYFLVGALTRAGRYTEALAACAEGMERTPPYWRLHMWRGRALSGLGQYTEALAELDRAIDLDPGAGEALLSRALFHHEQGDSRAALADYDAYLRTAPGDVEALSNRGSIRHDLGDLTGALEDLSTAIGLNPQMVAARANRAAVLFDLGRLDEALGDLDAALALDPSNELLLQNREALLASQSR